MNNERNPEWMNDDLVRNIPTEKLEFLKELFESGHNKSQKELMISILPMVKKAKEKGLALTNEELNAAIAAIKKYSTKTEQEQINHILNKAKKE